MPTSARLGNIGAAPSTCHRYRTPPVTGEPCLSHREALSCPGCLTSVLAGPVLLQPYTNGPAVWFVPSNLCIGLVEYLSPASKTMLSSYLAFLYRGGTNSALDLEPCVTTLIIFCSGIYSGGIISITSKRCC